MSFIRSFIAVDLPLSTKNEIGEYQKTLTPKISSVVWEKPENFHINLLFLGQTKKPQLDLLTQTFPVMIKKAPFTLNPGHLEYLYKKHADSIIYVSVEGELKKLYELREQVTRAVKHTLKFDSPGRYLAHITIGRIKPYIGHQDTKNILAQILSFQPKKKFHPFVVDQIKIMQTNFSSDTTHTYSAFSTQSLSLQAP